MTLKILFKLKKYKEVDDKNLQVKLCCFSFSSNTYLQRTTAKNIANQIELIIQIYVTCSTPTFSYNFSNDYANI